jgi:hypothetical protein
MQTITTQNFIFTQKDGRNWDIHFSKTKQKAGNLDIVNGFFQLEQVERATFGFSVTSDLQAVFNGISQRIQDLFQYAYTLNENIEFGQGLGCRRWLPNRTEYCAF